MRASQRPAPQRGELDARFVLVDRPAKRLAEASPVTLGDVTSRARSAVARAARARCVAPSRGSIREGRIRATWSSREFSVNFFWNVADDTREITALKSECEQLRVQVELLTGQKDAAFEEMERLKDQVYTRFVARASSLRRFSLAASTSASASPPRRLSLSVFIRLWMFLCRVSFALSASPSFSEKPSVLPAIAYPRWYIEER